MSEIDDTRRCPDCGYTEEDARVQMDHKLCPNYGFFDGERPGPDPDEEMEKRFAQENAAKHGIEYADDDG